LRAQGWHAKIPQAIKSEATQMYIKYIAIIVGFSMLSFLGGLIKLGGAASIALDSWVSFFVAGFFGPLLGAPVAGIAHLLSAASGGFPFGISVHLLIAILQVVWAFLFGWIALRFLNWWGLLIAAAVAVFCNGVVAPVIIGTVFPHLWNPVIGLIPVLAMASGVNAVIAMIVIIAIRRIKQ
jgi:hypothetical protein